MSRFTVALGLFTGTVEASGALRPTAPGVRLPRWSARDGEGLDPDRAGKTTLHTAQHMFASHRAQQGVSFQEIAYLLGHSSLHVTPRYAHLAPDSGRRAITVLERCLDPGGASDLRDGFVPYQAA